MHRARSLPVLACCAGIVVVCGGRRRAQRQPESRRHSADPGGIGGTGRAVHGIQADDRCRLASAKARVDRRAPRGQRDPAALGRCAGKRAAPVDGVPRSGEVWRLPVQGSRDAHFFARCARQRAAADLPARSCGSKSGSVDRRAPKKRSRRIHSCARPSAFFDHRRRYRRQARESEHRSDAARSARGGEIAQDRDPPRHGMGLFFVLLRRQAARPGRVQIRQRKLRLDHGRYDRREAPRAAHRRRDASANHLVGQPPLFARWKGIVPGNGSGRRIPPACVFRSCDGKGRLFRRRRRLGRRGHRALARRAHACGHHQRSRRRRAAPL